MVLQVVAIYAPFTAFSPFYAGMRRMAFRILSYLERILTPPARFREAQRQISRNIQRQRLSPFTRQARVVSLCAPRKAASGS